MTPLAGAARAAATWRDTLGVPVHLDGARLWNAHVATGTSLAEFAACADTVMVSFSKGLGAPVGAALAGPRDVIGAREPGAQAIWRRHAAVGDARRRRALRTACTTSPASPTTTRRAQRLAAALDGAGGARVVPPDTNIVMLDLPQCRAPTTSRGDAARSVCALSSWSHARVRAVTHRDVRPRAARCARAGDGGAAWRRCWRAWAGDRTGLTAQPRARSRCARASSARRPPCPASSVRLPFRCPRSRRAGARQLRQDPAGSNGTWCLPSLRQAWGIAPVRSLPRFNGASVAPAL